MLGMFDPKSITHIPAATATGDAFERVLTPAAYSDAISEISSWRGYAATPLHALDCAAEEIGIHKIYYKDEGQRFGLGSFKALGGAYAGLRVLVRELSKRLGHAVKTADIRAGKYAEDAQAIKLVSATDGNHGRSLAWGCQTFGVPCRIYIHAEVSKYREQSMTDLGADVIRIDGDYDASVRMAREEADANGWFVVSDTSWEGYTQPPLDVMAGYGVMASEICNQIPEAPTHVFLQGGVGGLAASVAAYLKQYWQVNCPRVVIVEPSLAACLYASADAGTLTAVTIEEETVMAGLSCGEPSPLAWEILREQAGNYITIDENLVGPAMRLLAHPIAGDPSIEAGESAVAGFAALIAASKSKDISTALGLDAQSRALIIGSEGITDPEVYQKMMTEVA